MSDRYPGGIISKTAPTPTGPYENGTAPGIWSLEQQMQYQQQGIWPIAGNVPNYIEDVFSTWLYTGNGSTQTITNGIDLSGKGGLVWTKARVTAGLGNELTDTARGAGLRLISNTTGAQGGAGSSDTTGFTSSGFQLTFNNGLGNLTGENYVSWTFREQPKFFDIVTYTGNGTAGRQIAHSLGSTPGFLVVKNTATSGTDWNCWHRSIPTSFTVLNATYAANAAGAAYFGNGSTAISPTSTVFTVSDALDVNASGQTYVAYLFAHDAGGFGLSGTDNVISCGSFTTDSSGNFTTTLGYEPQWILFKNSGASSNWNLIDTMRGWPVGAGSSYLRPNTSGAETTDSTPYMIPTATGFAGINNGWGNTQTYIYIAIRRGPMKVPTSGTSVYNGIARTGTSSPTTVTGVGFPPDLVIGSGRSNATGKTPFDRLRGATYYLDTTVTSAEGTDATSLTSFAVMDGYGVGADGGSVNTVNFAIPLVSWNFRRAPSFFDEVCYTGNYAANPQVPHNLGVPPEMLIARTRADTGQWYIKHIGMSDTQEIYFNNGAASAGPTWVRTSTYWQYSSAQYPNDAHVAYLFATCAGVSKVGSYTGTGATQTIDCGFTGGARFVLIKRTNATGDWCVWDTARGMVSGTDPRLFLNSSSAEYNNDWVYTTTGGFQIVTSDTNVNASGSTYIYLAIA